VLIALAIKSGLGYAAKYGVTYHLAGYAAISLGAGLVLFLLSLWAIRTRCGVVTNAAWFVSVGGSLALAALAFVAPLWLSLALASVLAGSAVMVIRRSPGTDHD
jgi:hypothetical protein